MALALVDVDWISASKADFTVASRVKVGDNNMGHTGVFCRSCERMCVKATDTW